MNVLRRAPAWTLTVALAGVYLIIAPQSPDLAAASYRSHLFSQVGFSLWDNSWLGGHHLPAYSLLAPALGALIGPQLVAAIAMCAVSALFAPIIAGRFTARGERIAALWLALGAGISLLSTRVPFDLGLAIGLGAVVLAQRERMWWALGLSVLTSLASPVAGAFLAVAMLAWALARRRAWPAALCLAALIPIGLLAVVFPEGGTQPFDGSAFYPALLGVIVLVAVIPAEQRALRIGAVLYGLVLVGSFVIPSAVGGNADRLGALMAGPVAACVLTVGAPGARAHAGADGARPLPALLAGQRARLGLHRGRLESGRPRLLLHPAAERAARAGRGLRAPGPHGSRSSRATPTGRPAGSPRT